MFSIDKRMLLASCVLLPGLAPVAHASGGPGTPTIKLATTGTHGFPYLFGN